MRGKAPRRRAGAWWSWGASSWPLSTCYCTAAGEARLACLLSQSWTHGGLVVLTCWFAGVGLEMCALAGGFRGRSVSRCRRKISNVSPGAHSRDKVRPRRAGFEGWSGVTAVEVCMSVLEQRLADPALGGWPGASTASGLGTYRLPSDRQRCPGSCEADAAVGRRVPPT